MRRLIALTVITLFGVGVAACGLPNDDKFTQIDEADDGFGLSKPSTTTTSTTTIPTTTIDATTSSTIEITTTSVPVEQVDIYFPSGRQLSKVQVALAADPTLNQVLASMLSGPPAGDAFVGLRSILPPKAQITANKVDGVAVVDFPEGLFEEMEPRDQRLVFGQIVLTMTSQRGVGQVRFTKAGEPFSVYRGDGSLTAPDETLSADDYLTLLTGVDVPIETTTTSTTLPPPPDTVITAALDG
ncbi:MAG: hypothetical protein JWN99_3310 [Ilumatobacteraceae bacterium]|nr:hypothetical protein [Ilumatobacteraceae bacterium]